MHLKMLYMKYWQGVNFYSAKMHFCVAINTLANIFNRQDHNDITVNNTSTIKWILNI